MMRGKIIKVNADRGFGFIRPADGGDDIFFHLTALRGLIFDDRLTQQSVEFASENGPRGPRATQIEPV